MVPEIKPEFANLVPPLTPAEKAQLEANIRAEGCLDPLVAWEGKGILLDGHHRLEICQRHEIEFKVVELPLESDAAARLWIIQHQLGKRNLESYQKCELALLAEEPIRAKAKERQREHGGTAPGRAGNTSGKVAQSENRRATDDLAEMAGVSRRTMDKARKVAAEAPEDIKAKLRAGEATINGEYVKLTKAKKRQQRMDELSGKAGDLVTGTRYPVVLADPPWRYEGRSMRPSDVIENQYPTMDLDEICTLPVVEAVTDDAILFMWTTGSKLEESFRVLNAWGFVYRTCAVWDKQRIGMGYYFRQQTEHLLVGTRGKMPTPAEGDRPASLISVKRGKHSVKPAVVYEIIERMYPGLPRLELFCRSPREGWDVWGNEV